MGHPSRPPTERSLLVAAGILAFVLHRFCPQYSVKASIPLTFVVVLATLFIIRLTWSSQIWPKLLSPIRHLPGPKSPSFFNGHFWTFQNKDPFPILREWGMTVPNDGLFKWYSLLNREFVVPTTPDTLRQILVTECYNFPKPIQSRRFIARLIGEGLLTVEGDEHKSQRRSLMPAFQSRHIKNLVPTFWSKAALMVNEFSNQHSTDLAGDGAVVDFSDWIARCTLDVISAAGMGVEFNSILDPDSHLITQYKRMLTPNWQDIFLEFANGFLPTAVTRKIPLTRNGEIEAAVQTVRNVSRDIIQQKKATFKSHGNDEVTLHRDILSVALASGDFDDEALVDQMMTFLGAGHETTSSTLQWALVSLSKEKAVQQRLREEVRAQLPSPTNDELTIVTADMIDACSYLQAVCAEVLRLYPALPATQREASKPTTVNGTYIPEGTYVLISPALTNTSEALWGTDAAEFNPERWLSRGKMRENTAIMGERASVNSGGAASNFANLTFLHGPHSCIGQSFAKWEFAALLAGIVGSFDFELDPVEMVIEAEQNLTARPKGGLTLRMKKV